MAAGRKTGGRRKGVPNKRTVALQQLSQQIASEGISPLEYMLRIMRDETLPSDRRDAMAVAAAPFVHPRLAAVEHSGEMTLNHEQALDELERKAREANRPATHH